MPRLPRNPVSVTPEVEPVYRKSAWGALICSQCHSVYVIKSNGIGPVECLKCHIDSFIITFDVYMSV